MALTFNAEASRTNTRGSEDAQTNSKTTLNFDEATKAYLDSILGNKEFSKQAAISDAEASADFAIKSALQSGAPAISSATKHAGGYNNTTAEMLGNDLTARSAGVGQQVLLDTITKYAAAESSKVQAATGAVAATSGRTVEEIKSAQSSSTQDKAGFSLTNAAKGGTVICTQLYKDGHLPLSVYLADIRYVRAHFSETTQNGYRFWAVPFVALMRRNRFAYAVGKYAGTRWSYHCASHVTAYMKGNIVGAALTAVLVPICYMIGRIAKPVAYQHLWKEGV
jgi:hypothetical protein